MFLTSHNTSFLRSNKKPIDRLCHIIRISPLITDTHTQLQGAGKKNYMELCTMVLTHSLALFSFWLKG